MMAKFFYFFFLLWLGIFSTSTAQIWVGPRANLALPLGPMDEYTDPRLSYGIEANFFLSDNISAGLAIDRYRFQLDISSLDLDIDFPINLENILKGAPVNFTVVPLIAGFRYTFTGERIRPYVGVEAGLHYVTAKGLGLEISRRFWGVAPLIGGLIPLNDQFSFFANAKIQLVLARDRVPIIGQELDGELIFIPLQAGFFFHLIR